MAATDQTPADPTNPTNPQAPKMTPATPMQAPQAAPQATAPPGGMRMQAMPSAPPRPAVAPLGATPAAVTPINPNADLRSAQIAPADSADLSTFKNQRLAASQALSAGPSRSAIAQQNLDAFDMAAQPGIRDQMREVSQKAAAVGGLGMGRTAVETLRPYTDYLTNRKALETKLAADSAQGEIQDRQNNLNAAEGLVGQEAGLGASARDELRGERGYQAGQEDQAYQRGIQGVSLEDALTNSAFNRALQTEVVGDQNNPASAQMALAGQYGNNAASAGTALSGILAQQGMLSGLKGVLGGGTGAPGGLPTGTTLPGGIDVGTPPPIVPPSSGPITTNPPPIRIPSAPPPISFGVNEPNPGAGGLSVAAGIGDAPPTTPPPQSIGDVLNLPPNTLPSGGGTPLMPPTRPDTSSLLRRQVLGY